MPGECALCSIFSIAVRPTSRCLQPGHRRQDCWAAPSAEHVTAAKLASGRHVGSWSCCVGRLWPTGAHEVWGHRWDASSGASVDGQANRLLLMPTEARSPSTHMLSCAFQTLHLSKASFSCRPDQASSHCGNNKSHQSPSSSYMKPGKHPSGSSRKASNLQLTSQQGIKYTQSTHPMYVYISPAPSHFLAKPKSHSFSSGGWLPSNRVLSSFRSLQGSWCRFALDKRILHD